MKYFVDICVLIIPMGMFFNGPEHWAIKKQE